MSEHTSLKNEIKRDLRLAEELAATPCAAPNVEPFVKVPVAVLEAGLSAQAFKLYAAIRRHADNETLETYVGRERLAEYLGMTKVASIDRYTRELVAAGLITSAERWKSKRDGRDWVHKKDADHTVRGSNLYAIMAGQGGSFSGGQAGPFLGTKVAPQKGHELEPFNQTPVTTSEKTSVGEAARPAKSVDKSMFGEKATTARPLHPEWTPNNANRSVAAEVGIDVEVAAEAFRAEMAGERRKGWGAAFSEWLRSKRSEDAVTSAAVDAAVDAMAQAVRAAAPTDGVEVEQVRPGAAPERATVGFSPIVVGGITWVGQRLGSLSDTERLLAGELLARGVMRSEVWTTLQDERNRPYGAHATTWTAVAA